ncbi:hypothetical protein [Bifidobacterium parmae]|uniref:Uncharacterized protein n=1 Tax=Bifidobacterium parmae TaxID=361854 RepID=A0A2N5J4M2_9BIFI|nr:hypothetical protein [Bifidobacterium parmae]PLS29166.1 hypothetical protein Uis4E_0744 [Bifidobacterium parmae]
MDTLVQIALDWDKGLIDDEKARERANAVPPVIYHKGDGYQEEGWYEGDRHHTYLAVNALEDAGRLAPGATRRFIDMLGR